MRVVYAIQVASLSYSGLKILDVKIGKTSNLKSTLSQYKRSHRQTKILDLWKSNEGISVSKCEKGVHSVAERYAYEKDSEKFIFLQDSYEEFSKTISRLLEPTTKREVEGKKIKGAANGKTGGLIGRTPELMKFKGKQFKVTTWRKVISILASQIYDEVDDFSKISEIRGREREYFTKNKNVLRTPKEIPGTSYYFEGNMSARSLNSIVDRLLEKFGYDRESDFKLILKQN